MSFGIKGEENSKKAHEQNLHEAVGSSTGDSQELKPHGLNLVPAELVWNGLIQFRKQGLA